MFDRILFPTDGSEGAELVLDHVLDVARTYDATLHVLNVADSTVHSATRVGGEVVDALEEQGEEIVAEAAAAAAERGVSTVTEVHQGGVPETIVEYADARGIDLVVMPTRGRTGLSRLLLGSVTERVLRSSATPVLTVNPDAAPIRYPYQNVLVPTDGSDTADVALEVGTDIATVHDAQLHVLSVVDVTSLGVDVYSEVQVDFLERRAETVIDEATEYARNQSVESVEGVVEYGSAVHRAIRSSVDEHDIDLVVMGTHGRSGLERYLLGSVAEKTVRTASVPVLTVPGHPADR
jgi:nucleotide-binding universal stress UspA family protein